MTIEEDPRPTFEVLDPASLTVLGNLPDAGAAEARAAVSAASDALPAWSATPPRVRSEILSRAHALMLRDRARLADLIAAENGKSLSDADGEVGYAAEFFRWFAEEAVRSEGAYGESPAGGTRTIVRHVPVGVAALVTPWNFPAAMATRKIAPALAAGCAVVLKPAAETPLTALAVHELLAEAGVPDDVVNVVPSTDASAVVGAWMTDKRVRKVSFTGSTRVGRLLLGQAAERVVRTSMELGGNAPFIVTEDADLDTAVAGAMVAKFRNGGQACTAANRFFVHDEIHDEFVNRFGSLVEKLTVGRASDGSAIGPLISASARDNVERAVNEAVRAGARVTHTAVVPDLRGHFVPPRVLVDVAWDAPIVTDEIFGPIASIIRWTDEAQMLQQVNSSEYGLAAYVFAGDLGRALRIAEAVEAGMVGINRGLVSDPSAPFGGFKQSGLGREGAREGLREFQETQYFSVEWPS